MISNWRIVVADLQLHFHLDLYDHAVLARPWPGVRSMILGLLDMNSRTRHVLTRKP